jgi:hypothetical protein
MAEFDPATPSPGDYTPEIIENLATTDTTSDPSLEKSLLAQALLHFLTEADVSEDELVERSDSESEENPSLFDGTSLFGTYITLCLLPISLILFRWSS